MNKCQYCGFIHDSVCPRVKKVEYYPDGQTKCVEFVEPKPANPILPHRDMQESHKVEVDLMESFR